MQVIHMLLLFYVHVIVIFPLTTSEHTAVLILARGGSKGIHLKNLREVGGISLLSRAILTAKFAGLNDVTISTDHPLIALEAIKRNVKIFKRSYITATDWAPSIWGVQEFIEYNAHITTLVLMQATSPFTTAERIKYSLRKLNHPKPYDCIFSVIRSRKLRWNFIDNQVHAINFDPKNRPRRQDWNREFIETGSFYIVRTGILRQGYFQNQNCTICEVTQHESLEIDSEFDILLANARSSLKIN